MRTPEIIVTANGFSIVTATRVTPVSFGGICAIVAYKRDEFTTDLICWDITVDSGDGEQVWTIHENMSGFDAVMARFEVLPGFNRQWREAVVLPPFAEQRMLIYRRSSAAV